MFFNKKPKNDSINTPILKEEKVISDNLQFIMSKTNLYYDKYNEEKDNFEKLYYQHLIENKKAILNFIIEKVVNDFVFTTNVYSEKFYLTLDQIERVFVDNFKTALHLPENKEFIYYFKMSIIISFLKEILELSEKDDFIYHISNDTVKINIIKFMNYIKLQSTESIDKYEFKNSPYRD